jgi:hypothetical protein
MLAGKEPNVPCGHSQAAGEGAGTAYNGHVPPNSLEAGGRLGEDPVTRPDHHAPEPFSHALIGEDPQECVIGAIWARGHKAAGIVGPAEPRRARAQVARRHDDMIAASDPGGTRIVQRKGRHPGGVRSRRPEEVLDVDQMKRPRRWMEAVLSAHAGQCA